MADKIAIRDARADELEIVEAVVREAYDEIRLKLSPEVWKIWSDSITDTLFSGRGEVMVADDNGEVVGAVQFLPELPKLSIVKWPDGASSMRVLSVRPAHRGRGIARSLVEECIRRARARGLEGLYLLTTGHMEAAKRLYARIGFLPYDGFDLSPFHPKELVEAYHLDLT